MSILLLAIPNAPSQADGLNSPAPIKGGADFPQETHRYTFSVFLNHGRTDEFMMHSGDLIGYSVHIIPVGFAWEGLVSFSEVVEVKMAVWLALHVPAEWFGCTRSSSCRLHSGWGAWKPGSSAAT